MENAEIAALPSVTRNDKKGLHHGLQRRSTKGVALFLQASPNCFLLFFSSPSMQQRLYFLPLLQGHCSLRPISSFFAVLSPVLNSFSRNFIVAFPRCGSGSCRPPPFIKIPRTKVRGIRVSFSCSWIRYHARNPSAPYVSLSNVAAGVARATAFIRPGPATGPSPRSRCRIRGSCRPGSDSGPS